MNKLTALWREYKGVLCFIGLMMLFRSAVADWNYVPSSSMNPTLVAGDRVLVNKMAYSLRLPFTLLEVARWDVPHAGDVITFDSPRDGLNLIKRVVAVGGDEVAMRDNQLIINGQPVPRTLLDPARELETESGLLNAQIWREQLAGIAIDVARLPQMNHLTRFGPVRVPAGKLLVLGDSRDNSNDSRFIGFIDIQRVTGQAFRVAMSHDPSNLYLPRLNRWWLPLHS
ncbi:MAG: signal peptidase I [Rhodoferax sp.]|uniref:signal peptidase I n=1 Tax=Rhodoferax sp. TaxID=50421 RepID=UPI00262B5D7D|nr:signal peptidase I [Rhodoferax sp.]MDD5336482.1 signal peptidase I [Rhodoferax sp.]